VEREIELLTARGARIYYDEGIDPGREWPEELASAVENCGAFVFFITRQSIDSRVCRGELAVALQAERPVIPVQLDDTELPAALRLQIGNRQAIIRSRFTQAEYRERLTSAVLAFQNAQPTAERDSTIFDRRETGRSATKRPSRRVVALTAIAVTVVLVAGASLAWRPQIISAWTGQEIAAKQQGLVVLPFENGSPEEADAYLSEGFSDELRDQLSRVPGLRVVARPSSIVFRGQNKPASLIAKELGVATVVEGRFRKDGDSLRIVVRLIDGTNDTQLWSQRYDRKSSDLLAIQQEVALAAARQILPQVDPNELRPEYEASVTDLMMLARNYQQKAASPEDWDKVVSLYRQVLELDPESALAHARLAKALLYQGKDVDAAERQARLALSINPNLAEARAVLGHLLWVQFRDGGSAELRQAVELNPNDADAQYYYGAYLSMQSGKNSETLMHFNRARELDPMSLLYTGTAATHHAQRGNLDEVAQLSTIIQERFPDAGGRFALSRILDSAGQLDEAIAWAMEAKRLDLEHEHVSHDIAERLARIGLDAESRRVEPESSLRVLFWQRRYDEIIERMSNVDLDEADADSLGYLAFALQAVGREAEAIPILESIGLPNIAMDDDVRRWAHLHHLAVLAGALRNVGETEQSKKLAAWLDQFATKLLPDNPHFITPGWGGHWWKACALAALGKREQALTEVEITAAAPNLAWLPYLRDAGCFRDLHDEPRYQKAIEGLEAKHDAIRDRLPATLAKHGFEMKDL
jgi:TolB-like protein